MLSVMEKKFELKGPAGIIAAVIVIGGVLVWKGPSGLMDLLRDGRTMRLSEKTLNTTGRQEIHNELTIYYRQKFQDPLMKAAGDNSGANQDAAEELLAMNKVLSTLKIETMKPRYRTRLDTGDRLELYIDVTYSMQPAPPDDKTNRTFSVDVERNGRGRWHIRRFE